MNYTEFGSANFAVFYADFVGWVERVKGECYYQYRIQRNCVNSDNYEKRVKGVNQ